MAKDCIIVIDPNPSYEIYNRRGSDPSEKLDPAKIPGSETRIYFYPIFLLFFDVFAVYCIPQGWLFLSFIDRIHAMVLLLDGSALTVESNRSCLKKSDVRQLSMLTNAFKG